MQTKQNNFYVQMMIFSQINTKTNIELSKRKRKQYNCNNNEEVKLFFSLFFSLLQVVEFWFHRSEDWCDR